MEGQHEGLVRLPRRFAPRDDVPATHPDTPHYAGIQKYTHNIMLPRSYNAGIKNNTRIGKGTRREREGEIATSLTALAMTDKNATTALRSG
ncbi:MAG: hypothetical protein J6C56_06715 [Alistipes sp.]|nr:hypothetical protein [Alistipes sp.]